jgi:hypothetical protein
MTRRGFCALSTGFVLAAVVGCSGVSTLIAYVGGGLPPGDTDIGGIVLTASVSATSADATPSAADTPVPGAQVTLYRGQQQVGQTLTGPDGYFRFQKPDTGEYSVVVDPPTGLGLRQARVQFRHQKGQRTFLTIELVPNP